MAQDFFVTLLGLVLSLFTGSALAWMAFEYCVGRLMHRVKHLVRLNLTERKVHKFSLARLPWPRFRYTIPKPL